MIKHLKSAWKWIWPEYDGEIKVTTLTSPATFFYGNNIKIISQVRDGDKTHINYKLVIKNWFSK